MTGRVVRCGVALLAVLALVGSACGSDVEGGASPAVEPVSEAPAGADVEVQEPAGATLPAGASGGPEVSADADGEVEAAGGVEVPADGDAGEPADAVAGVESSVDADVAAEESDPSVAEPGGDGSTPSGPDEAWVVLGELPAEVSVAASSGEVAVSWPATAAVEGSSRAGYEVQWRSGDQDWDEDRRVVVVGLSFVIGSLDDGVTYAVRVRPAAVQTATAQGASITAGAGSEPVAEVVLDAPALNSELYESVSALSGAVSFEMAGEPVWPATIEIPVDVDRIEDGAEPVLVYYNEALEAWVPAPGAVLDRERGVVVAEVYHLSLWDTIKRPITWAATGAWNFAGQVFDTVAGFVDWAWDTTTGWLSGGWNFLRDRVLGDVAELARATLDKAADVGTSVAGWVSDGLEAAASLPKAALDALASMAVSNLADLFSTNISPPRCSGGMPDWVSSIESEGSADRALLWCGETSNDDLKLKLTVNRGYSMHLQGETSNVNFGEYSSENIAVVGADSPSAISDQLVSAAYYYAGPSDTLLLSAASTTEMLVPPGAFRDQRSMRFGYQADQIATLIDTFLFGLDILTGSASKKSDDIPEVITCLHGIFREAAAGTALLDKINRAARECVAPAVGNLIGSAVISAAAVAIYGVVLLAEYGEMLVDGTITSGNRLILERDPTPPTTTTAPTPTVPGKPIITFQGIENQGPDCQVLMTRWAEPDDGGSAILGYEIRDRVYVLHPETGDWVEFEWVYLDFSLVVERPLEWSFSHFTDDISLVPEQRREFGVRAYNSVGKGPWSNTSTHEDTRLALCPSG